MKNPIGAGDAVSSGTILRWCGAVRNHGPGADGTKEVEEVEGLEGLEGLEGSDEERKWRAISDAFSWGLSCGAASCMGDANSVFNLSDAESLYSGIQSVSY